MIRKFVSEIISSMELGEWHGFLREAENSNYTEFLLLYKGMVFDGHRFILLGNVQDVSLTRIEKECLREVYYKLHNQFIIDNPTGDTLELAYRFGGISG